MNQVSTLNFAFLILPAWVVNWPGLGASIVIKIAFEHSYMERFSQIESALLVLLNFSSTSPLDLDDDDAPCKAQLSLSGKSIDD